MPGQHGTSLKDYIQALTTQLRLSKVPGRTIGQIVAEVESHVRETGEDPVEAFGQPGSYSAQFAQGRVPGGRRGWVLPRADIATSALAVGAVALVGGVLNLSVVVQVRANVVLWVAMGLTYAFLIRRLDLATANRRTRTVTAGLRVPGERAAPWLRFLVLLAMFELFLAIRSRVPSGPVLFSLPGWALSLVGLALTAGALWELHARSDRIVDPRESAKT